MPLKKSKLNFYSYKKVLKIVGPIRKEMLIYLFIFLEGSSKLEK